MPVSTQNDPIQLLRWYMDAGCDAVLADGGVDKFNLPLRQQNDVDVEQVTHSEAKAASTDTSRPPEASPPSQPGTQNTTPPANLRGTATALQSAREAAGSATSLQELRTVFEAFDGCALKQTARSFVFADGTPGAPLMIIGEAPGREEDRQGLPFVGRSGKLLDDMLAAISASRQENAYIANILPWRPPGDRTPTDGEIAVCLPFILKHIALAAPRMVLLLGGTAAKSLLLRREGITRLRGTWSQINLAAHGMEIHGAPAVLALPTFHPAYLLRTPQQKRLVWRDLIQVKDKIHN